MLPHCKARETEREGLIDHSSSFFIVENLLHELGESYDEVILVGWPAPSVPRGKTERLAAGRSRASPAVPFIGFF